MSTRVERWQAKERKARERLAKLEARCQFTGREAYGCVAAELDCDEPVAQVLEGLDETVVQTAKAYSAVAHKRWPPEPERSGWRVTVNSWDWS